MEAVIYHELYHQYSRDPLKIFLISLISSTIWYIPILKWFHQKHKIVKELLADEYAMEKQGNPADLGSALLKMIKVGNQIKMPFSYVSFADTSVNYRIKYILDPLTEPSLKFPVKLTVMSLYIFFMLCGLFIYLCTVPHRPRPAVRRAIIAIPFFAAILLAMRLDGPIRARADAAHPGFTLRDETAAAGIHFVHRRRRSIRRSPASSRTSPRSAHPSRSPTSTATAGPISTSPTAASASRTRSIATSGDGTFEDVARERGRGRPQSRRAKASRWAPSGATSTTTAARTCSSIATAISSLFRNVDGKRFEDVTEQAGLHRWVNSNGAIWLDYDRDGLLDLYVTAYFRNDIDLWHLTTTRIMHNSFEFADQRRKESALPQPRRRQVRGRHRQDGRRQHALDARRRVGRLQRRRLARHLPRQRLRPGGAVPQRPRHSDSCSTHRRSRERIEERHVRRRSATRSTAAGSTRSSRTSPSAATSSRTTTCA